MIELFLTSKELDIILAALSSLALALGKSANADEVDSDYWDNQRNGVVRLRMKLTKMV